MNTKSRFAYKPKADILAVKWDGVDRQSILDFVQEVIIDHLHWHYESASSAVRFTADDDTLDASEEDNMLIFEWGLEVDPGWWIYLEPDEDEPKVIFDSHFNAIFGG